MKRAGPFTAGRNATSKYYVFEGRFGKVFKIPVSFDPVIPLLQGFVPSFWYKVDLHGVVYNCSQMKAT